MTKMHTDTVNMMVNCFSTVAIAQAYVELAVAIEKDKMAERDEDPELREALGILGDNLAYQVIRAAQ